VNKKNNLKEPLAINWGFFCPNEKAYSSSCNWNTTDQLRIADWKLMSKWKTDIANWQAVFGFDTEWNSSMVLWRPVVWDPDSWWFWDKSSWQRNHPWLSNIYNWIMMYSLVSNGINIAVNNNKMNSDPKQWKAWNKTFICNTEDNLTIYMWYVDNVTFSSLADYLIKTFKCYNAILLDNWWTKAMIYDEKYVAGPWRNMMDAFVIIEDKNAPKSDTIVSTTNNYTVSTKVKTRIDTIMLVVKDERSKKYSLQEQKNRYQNIVDSFSKIKLQWEQKEMIDYLIYLFKNKLKELN